MSVNDPIKRHRVDGWILKSNSFYLVTSVSPDPKTHTD